MDSARRAPSHWHVIATIARREVAMAARRRIVRVFFTMSLLPPIVFGTVLVVRVIVEQNFGMDIGFDPVMLMLFIQLGPVSLLALSLGIPIVSRDRAEEVMYLYAVRPVFPVHYAAGKMLAVAVPTFLLLAVPGLLITVLRQGILGDAVKTTESILLAGKVLLSGVLAALVWSGLFVGASAAVKRARWALLLSFGVLVAADAVGGILAFVGGVSEARVVSPDDALIAVMQFLFGDGGTLVAILGMVSILAYAALGLAVVMLRVRTEMTP